MKEITKSEQNFAISLSLKKMYLIFPTFKLLKKKKFFFLFQNKLEKLHKTHQKSLNLFHEHKETIDLILIIVMHYFLYKSITQKHTKTKIKYGQKKNLNLMFLPSGKFLLS
jgi:hypothetical protein